MSKAFTFSKVRDIATDATPRPVASLCLHTHLLAAAPRCCAVRRYPTCDAPDIGVGRARADHLAAHADECIILPGMDGFSPDWLRSTNEVLACVRAKLKS